MPSLTIYIQHSIGSPRHSIQTKKRNKKYPNWKGGIKLSLFAGDMIVYIENPTDSTRKLLDIINEFGKTAGFKVNNQVLRHFCTITKYQKQKSGEKSYLI